MPEENNQKGLNSKNLNSKKCFDTNFYNDSTMNYSLKNSKSQKKSSFKDSSKVKGKLVGEHFLKKVNLFSNQNKLIEINLFPSKKKQLSDLQFSSEGNDLNIFQIKINKKLHFESNCLLNLSLTNFKRATTTYFVENCSFNDIFIFSAKFKKELFSSNINNINIQHKDNSTNIFKTSFCTFPQININYENIFPKLLLKKQNNFVTKITELNIFVNTEAVKPKLTFESLNLLENSLIKSNQRADSLQKLFILSNNLNSLALNEKGKFLNASNAHESLNITNCKTVKYWDKRVLNIAQTSQLFIGFNHYKRKVNLEFCKPYVINLINHNSISLKPHLLDFFAINTLSIIESICNKFKDKKISNIFEDANKLIIESFDIQIEKQSVNSDINNSRRSINSLSLINILNKNRISPAFLSFPEKLRQNIKSGMFSNINCLNLFKSNELFIGVEKSNNFPYLQ